MKSKAYQDALKDDDDDDDDDDDEDTGASTAPKGPQSIGDLMKSKAYRDAVQGSTSAKPNVPPSSAPRSIEI